MRKYTIALGALPALVLMALSAALPQSASAGPVKNLRDCDGSYHGTYKNVTVRSGASCTLTSDAVVLGGVHAKKGAVDVVIQTDVARNINVHGATGSVVVGPAGCRFDPAVGNNLSVTDSHNVLVCLATVRNNIKVTRNDGRVTLRDSAAGNIRADRNLAFVADGPIAHGDPGAIRLLRLQAAKHISAKHNDPSRAVIMRDVQDGLGH